MLKNDLKIAWRNLRKHRLFSLLNLLGLALGLAVFFLMALLIADDLRYDRFHERADRIARVTMQVRMQGEETEVAVTGTKVAPAFVRAFPEVEAGVRTYMDNATVRRGEKLFREPRFLYADSAFFGVFTFPLRAGDPTTALAAPDRVVLTERAAAKYFGEENPVGQTLLVDGYDYLVAGVAADPPSHSQLKFDFVASFTSLSVAEREEWWSANYVTYLLLRDPAALGALQAKIPGYMRGQSAETGMAGEDYLTYTLEPLVDVHLHSELAGHEPNGDIRYVWGLTAVALLILLIACVNYVNLATARSADRAREVSVRKVLGAERAGLFRQFWGEALLLTAVALLAAGLLAALVLPSLNEVAGRTLAFGVFSPLRLGAVLVGLCLVVSLLAGGYPALVLTRFRPVAALKGRGTGATSGQWLRKGLIMFQFVVSSFLIIGTLVVRQQMEYVQDRKLGYNPERVVVLPAERAILKNLAAVKNAWTGDPRVASVTAAYETPTFIEGSYTLERPGSEETPLVAAIPVDGDFVRTLEIDLLAGRDFTAAEQALANEREASEDYAFLLNASAAKNLGWTPDDALGQPITVSGRAGQVVGVTDDFHFASLRENVGPLVMMLERQTWGVVMVRLAGNDLQASLNFLRADWAARVPDRPFDYWFLDDEFDQLYRQEQRLETVFSVFAGLAVLLASLGLIGLSAFTAARRTKEIGIRKVLGASVGGLVLMLVRDFLLLVGVAFAVAVPLAAWAMQRWLADFAYRVELHVGVFVAAGLLAAVAAGLTVGWESLRAARVDPVTSL
ncbi:MAG: ABC transporter permease, partial [Catalinimonas sp.]